MCGVRYSVFATSHARLLSVLPLLWAAWRTTAAEPMGMEQCIAYAREHSPTVRKLRLDLMNRQLQTRIERAAFALGLRLDSSYADEADADHTRMTLSRDFLGGVKLSTTLEADRSHLNNDDSANFSVRLSKKILGGGTLLESRNLIDDSLVNETIALNNLSRQQRQLVLDVKRKYYQIIRDGRSLTIQQRRLERSRKNLKYAIEREKPLDIITARIEVPRNELSVVVAERAIQTGLDDLKVSIGMPVEEELAIVEEFEFQVIETDAATDLAYAIEHHESFLNNRLENKKLQWEVEIHRSRLWPDLEVSLTHSKRSSGTHLNLDGDEEQTVGLGVSWELGRRADRARYERVRNDLRKNEVDFFSLRQTTGRRLMELSSQLAERARSIELQEQQVELVSRQAELYADRWDHGEIDILELVRSQNDLENNRVELNNLKAQYMVLLADYEFNAGR